MLLIYLPFMTQDSKSICFSVPFCDTNISSVSSELQWKTRIPVNPVVFLSRIFCLRKQKQWQRIKTLWSETHSFSMPVQQPSEEWSFQTLPKAPFLLTHVILQFYHKLKKSFDDNSLITLWTLHTLTVSVLHVEL